MSAADPASCCFATTGSAQPVHLWDALTGALPCCAAARDLQAQALACRQRRAAEQGAHLARLLPPSCAPVPSVPPPPPRILLQGSCAAATVCTTSWTRWPQPTAWPSHQTATASSAGSTAAWPPSAWNARAGGRAGARGGGGDRMLGRAGVALPARKDTSPQALKVGQGRGCAALPRPAAAAAAGNYIGPSPRFARCRECQTLAAFKRGQEGLPGIVSCLAPNPDRSGMLAAGSFAGGAALLDSRSRELLCLMEGGHAGGLTHVSCCGPMFGGGCVSVLCALCTGWPSPPAVATYQRTNTRTLSCCPFPAALLLCRWQLSVHRGAAGPGHPLLGRALCFG
jgi:hypothetical protein